MAAVANPIMSQKVSKNYRTENKGKLCLTSANVTEFNFPSGRAKDNLFALY